MHISIGKTMDAWTDDDINIEEFKTKFLRFYKYN